MFRIGVINYSIAVDFEEGVRKTT